MIALWLLGAAHAAGYHYLKVGGLYGTADDEPLEAGFEASVFSDGLVYWMTFGDPSLDGHRVKEAWLESHHYGPQLGKEPDALADEDTSRRLPLWLGDIGWFRVGADHTLRKIFEIDGSRHLMLSLPGFWNVGAERFHFGPTAGLGWNLTWWENWKDRTDTTVNTGKFTVEAGWVVGALWWETVFAQGRVTGHYDLFGIHQTQLKVAGITGVYLDRVNVPLGLELKGELDRGNDTVNTQLLETWAVRAAIVYRIIPRTREEDVQELLETLQSLDAADPTPPTVPTESALEEGTDPGTEEGSEAEPVEPTPAAGAAPDEGAQDATHDSATTPAATAPASPAPTGPPQ